MPIQAPQWTEFLSCPVCYNVFNETHHRPISLACGHTVCKSCLLKFQQRKCPFDQSVITRNIEELPANFALLQLVSITATPDVKKGCVPEEYKKFYEHSKSCVEELALLLKPVSSTTTGSIISAPVSSAGTQTGATCVLSRPMQRKLITLVNCQLVEDEGRARALRAARSLGERTVTELILQHQNPQQLSSNLWAAVRGRGCQFLGPGMQEEVLKLILLALEDGSALSRKVLVLFVVQRLEAQYPQASKTAIGHVVQLLYRASCFKVTKRDEESSLMQLKEEYRTYDTLRREHDSQIVQIAMEAGLRIAPDQWSSLLYGDSTHKSHMQSIIDKLQTPQTFSQSVSELLIALQRTSDPHNLQRLRPELEFLASIDPSPDVPSPSWENLDGVMKAVKTVVEGLVYFLQNSGIRKHDFLTPFNTRYKTSMCRDFQERSHCPRASNCTFAHSEDELDKYRQKNKRASKGLMMHRVDHDEDDDDLRTQASGDRPDLLMDMKNIPHQVQKKSNYTSLLMGARPQVQPTYNRGTQPPLGTMSTIAASSDTIPGQHNVLPAPGGAASAMPVGTLQPGGVAAHGHSDLIVTPQGLVQAAGPGGINMNQTQQQPQVPGFVPAQAQSPAGFAQQGLPQQNQMVVDPAAGVAMQVNADSAILQAGSVIPQPGQVVVPPQNPIVNTGQMPMQQAPPQGMQVQNPAVMPGVNQDGQQTMQAGMQPGHSMMNPYMTPYGPAGPGMMGPRFPMHHPMMYPYPPMHPYMAYYPQGFYPPDSSRMPYDKYYTSLNPFAEPWNPSYGSQYPDQYRNKGDDSCAMCNQKQAEQRQQQQKQQQQQQLYHGHSRTCQHAGEAKPSYIQTQTDVSNISPAQQPKQQHYQQQEYQQQQQYQQHVKEASDEKHSHLQQQQQQSGYHQLKHQHQQNAGSQQPQGSVAQSTSQHQPHDLKHYPSYSSHDDSLEVYSQESDRTTTYQQQQHKHKQHEISYDSEAYGQYARPQFQHNAKSDHNTQIVTSQYTSQQKYQQQPQTVEAGRDGSISHYQQYSAVRSEASWERSPEDEDYYLYSRSEGQMNMTSSHVYSHPDTGASLQQYQSDQEYEHTNVQARASKDVPLLPMVDEPNAQLHRQSLDNLKERREVILAKLQEINKDTVSVSKLEVHKEELPPLFKYVHMDVKESGAYKNTLKHPSPMDTGPASLKDQLPSNGEIFERLGAISGYPPRSVNDSIMTSWATSTLNSSSRPKNSTEWSSDVDQPKGSAGSHKYDPQTTDSKTHISKYDAPVQSKEKNSEWKCDENNFPYWKDITENLDSPISTPPTTPQPVHSANSSKPHITSASFSDTYRLKSLSTYTSSPQVAAQSFPSSLAKISKPVFTSPSVMTTSMPKYSTPHSAFETDYLYSKTSYNSVTKADDFPTRSTHSWSYGIDEPTSYTQTSYRSYTSDYGQTVKSSTSVYNSLAEYSAPNSYWTSTAYSTNGCPISTTGYSSSVFGMTSANEEDHIPFVEGSPTISKFGPISRVTRANKTEPVKATADEMAITAPVTAVTPLNGPPLPSTEMVPSRFTQDGTTLKVSNGTDETSGIEQEKYKAYSLWTNEVNFLEMKAKEANTEDEKLCVRLQAVELQISMKEQLLEQAQATGRRQAERSEYMKKRQQDQHSEAVSSEHCKDDANYPNSN